MLRLQTVRWREADQGVPGSVLPKHCGIETDSRDLPQGSALHGIHLPELGLLTSADLGLSLSFKLPPGTGGLRCDRQAGSMPSLAVCKDSWVGGGM